MASRLVTQATPGNPGQPGLSPQVRVRSDKGWPRCTGGQGPGARGTAENWGLQSELMLTCWVTRARPLSPGMTNASLYWLQTLKGNALFGALGELGIRGDQGRPARASCKPWAASDPVCACAACVAWLGVRPCVPKSLPGFPRDPASGLGGVTGGWLPRKEGQVHSGKRAGPEASGPGGSVVTRVAVVPTPWERPGWVGDGAIGLHT